jgi:hypothetical protein
MIAESAELNVLQATQGEEKKEDASTGNAKIDLELAKIKGQMDSFAEVRKATTERFSRISEQMGELRGMVIDTNKAMGKVEVSATKAVDLVESVHPEKLMIEVRKQDGKIEALRASIESNEAIMKDLMLELKKMRDRMGFYKGVEQVVAMNEEIKQELATMKRIEANIGRHADKVETVFLEVEKKFTEFDKFNDVTKDLDKQFKRLSSDFEKVRVKIEMKLERKDFIDLLDKFNDFEKHTTNLLKLLDERNKAARQEIDADFKGLEIEYRKKLEAMRPPSKPLPPPAAQPAQGVSKEQVEQVAGGSGEDGAGGDIKPTVMMKLKGFLFKEKAEAPGEAKPEAPPEEKPAEGVKAAEPVKPEAQKADAEVKPVATLKSTPEKSGPKPGEKPAVPPSA